jgi:CubicO group peptidase (beta-lactamase class C family)
MIRYLTIVLLVFLLFSCSVAQSRVQSDPAESMDGYLSRLYSSPFGKPSVAVSVVSHGQIVFENGYGVAAPSGLRADSHTRFLLASVAKQITAMAVMMLKESGRFQYDTPVADFFPEFRVLLRARQSGSCCSTRLVFLPMEKFAIREADA